MKNYIVWISLAAAMGGLLFGFDTAVISGVIEFIEKPDVFDLSDLSKGFTVSSLIIGCILGCLFASALGDFLGRKRSLMLSASLFFISSVGCALSAALTSFVAFRILGGIGVGTASILSPLYIAEIAPAHLRGRLVSLNQLTIVTGILLAYLSNYFLSVMTDGNWRWMTGIMAVPSLLFLISLVFVPESPRWMVMRGFHDRALKTLSKVNDPLRAKEELASIRNSVEKEEDQGKFRDLFHKKVRRVFFVAVLLAVFQQITGINSIIYYAPAIFVKAGLATSSALLQTAVIGIINLLFTFVSISLVDKLGRRPLMIAGISGMAVFLVLVTLTFYIPQLNGLLTLLFILGFCASFSSSIGPIVWVVISEILPNKIRNIGVSVAVLCLWSANFALSSFFPWMLEHMGGLSFMVFFFCCLGMILIVKYRVPETKNKTLEEIEHGLFIH